MTDPARPTRRRCFLRASGRGAAVLALPAWGRPVGAAPAPLQLLHTHTGERLAIVLPGNGTPPRPAQAALEQFLRDHYNGVVGPIDPGLFVQLQALQRLLRSDGPWEVISGFRSAETNERLRRRGGGGVARGSLHLQGRAIDVRMAGVALAELRDAALSLRQGGVGFYAVERFVHLDTGPVRRW